MKKKKVLIVSVSAGSGHVRAAQAIEQAAAAFPNAKVQHIMSLHRSRQQLLMYMSSLLSVPRNCGATYMIRLMKQIG